MKARIQVFPEYSLSQIYFPGPVWMPISPAGRGTFGSSAKAAL
jgi:hypothetical protein